MKSLYDFREFLKDFVRVLYNSGEGLYNFNEVLNNSDECLYNSVDGIKNFPLVAAKLLMGFGEYKMKIFVLFA